MCAWLGVFTSGYCEWRTRPDSATTRRRVRLKHRFLRHVGGGLKIRAEIQQEGDQPTAA
jgi:hypothetical protein